MSMSHSTGSLSWVLLRQAVIREADSVERDVPSHWNNVDGATSVESCTLSKYYPLPHGWRHRTPAQPRPLCLGTLKNEPDECSVAFWALARGEGCKPRSQANTLSHSHLFLPTVCLQYHFFCVRDLFSPSRRLPSRYLCMRPYTVYV